MRSLVIKAIEIYQVTLSPYFRGACRHFPSCSSYTREAVVRYGASKGLWLGLRRIGRCRPLGTWGYDPVP